MEQHFDPEALSAFIDGEASAERSAIEQHLARCNECSRVKTVLGSAAAALAILEDDPVSSDEHRRLRQAIVATAPAKRSWFLRPNWMAAGGLACIVVAAIGFAAINRTPKTEINSAAPSGYNELLDSSALSLESDRQVRDAVTVMPEVNQAVSRTSQKAAAAGAAEDSAGFSSREQVSSAPPASVESSAGNQLAALGPFSAPRASECLVKVQASQPYRMAPLMVRAVQFKGVQAWLLAFAWTPSSDPQANLDQIQVWMFSPDDCAALEGDALVEKVLHYSSFRSSG